MNSQLIKALAITTAMVLSQQAVAGGPSPEPYPDVSNSDSFYVGAHGGAAIPSDSRLNTGYDVGAQVGYRFMQAIRAEFAFTYINHSDSVANFRASANIYTYMVNGYYDFTLGKFAPFLGAGIGYMDGNVTTNFAGNSPTQGSFAYQGIAGVGLKVTEQITVSVAYRYLAASKGSGHENIIQGSVDYYFG